jgi:hypothetical protein
MGEGEGPASYDGLGPEGYGLKGIRQGCLGALLGILIILLLLFFGPCSPSDVEGGAGETERVEKTEAKQSTSVQLEYMHDVGLGPVADYLLEKGGDIK